MRDAANQERETINEPVPEGAMEKWVPVLWIIGSGIGVFLLLLFIVF